MSALVGASGEQPVLALLFAAARAVMKLTDEGSPPSRGADKSRRFVSLAQLLPMAPKNEAATYWQGSPHDKGKSLPVCRVLRRGQPE